MLLGYARFATRAPDVNQQLRALEAAGCERVYADRRAGFTTLRPQLEAVLQRLDGGDVLVVTTLDRLAVSLRELVDRVRQIETRGASLRALAGEIDTGTATGRQLVEALASFERNTAGERIQIGMSEAKTIGRHVGRPRLLGLREVRDAVARVVAGEPVSSIARSLCVSAQTLRRAMRSSGLEELGELNL